MAKFTERYEALKEKEIKDLRKALKKVGGEWHFGWDYCGEEPSGGDFPCVTINDDHAVDVKILAVSLCGDSFSFVAEDWEYGEDMGEIDIDDFYYGQIQYITEEILNNF